MQLDLLKDIFIYEQTMRGGDDQRKKANDIVKHMYHKQNDKKEQNKEKGKQEEEAEEGQEVEEENEGEDVYELLGKVELVQPQEKNIKSIENCISYA